MAMFPHICRSTVPATLKAASRRFAGSQFPYLVIWLLFAVFGCADVDAMTMLPRICRSTVPATMWAAVRSPVVSIVLVKKGDINMELTSCKFASLPTAASKPVLVVVSLVLGGILMKLTLYNFTSLPARRSR